MTQLSIRVWKRKRMSFGRHRLLCRINSLSLEEVDVGHLLGMLRSIHLLEAAVQEAVNKDTDAQAMSLSLL